MSGVHRCSRVSDSDKSGQRDKGIRFQDHRSHGGRHPKGFCRDKLTSTQLVDFYLERIRSFNPILRSVLELNPDARAQAEEADRERRDQVGESSRRGPLHGIPVLLKDSIATNDKLNTTAGSYALVGSKVAREAHVEEKLRLAGSVILGKASLTEWYTRTPINWCARGGFAVNPYVERGNTCGSSYGSAISVAANMVAVSLGTETDGSIICPADRNSVVGIKPTVGLTSRAGVIPLSPRQDSIGPICRTVSDAVHVLDVIVGFDPRDEATHSASKYIPPGGYKQFLSKEGLRGKRLGIVRNPFSHPYNGSLAISVFEHHLNTLRDEATHSASKYIPPGGYKQFLSKEGLRGKRLGIVRNPFSHPYNGSLAISVFEHHLNTLRARCATVIDNLEIPNISIIQNPSESGELVVFLAELKLSFNKYLKELISSPVRSLADIIQFNIDHPDLEKTKEYGQELFIESEKTNGSGEEEKEAVKRFDGLSIEGFGKVMKENELDGLVTLGSDAASMLAIGGYPAITVPAGYDNSGMPFGPFGICFSGLRGTEPKLIEIAFDFEQSSLARKPPPSPFASL